MMFGFGIFSHWKKFGIATNTLMAEHVLSYANDELLKSIGEQVKLILTLGARRSWSDEYFRSMFDEKNRQIQLNIIAMALFELGIEPPFKGQIWYLWGRSPYVEKLYDTDILKYQKDIYIKKYGVVINISEKKLKLSDFFISGERKFESDNVNAGEENQLHIGIEDGDVNAGYRHGIVYDKTTKKVTIRDAAWFMNEAKKGNIKAQSELGLMYEIEKEVYQNSQEAAKWFRLAAENGNAQAQFHLGLLYNEGRGVDKNEQEAFKWFRLAAKRGYIDAQYSLGWSYENGEGVAQNFQDAVCWYRLSAQQGDASSQISLGSMYKNGKGVGKNDQEAVKWFRLAADQGSPLAQYNLGIMYSEGRGVTQNDQEAFKWYRLAAEHGLADAQYSLAIMHQMGWGVLQNNQEALKFYKLAAKKGLSTAQYNLGVMYENGSGIAPSISRAYIWYTLAAEQGDTDAVKAKGEVENRLSTFDLARAQAQATRCFESNYQDCD